MTVTARARPEVLKKKKTLTGWRQLRAAKSFALRARTRLSIATLLPISQQADDFVDRGMQYPALKIKSSRFERVAFDRFGQYILRLHLPGECVSPLL